MPVIRPTARLWRELNGRGRLPDYVAAHEPCRMSDWFATSLSVLRKRMVLFAHRETIFTVLAPMAPLEALAAIFRQALERELIRIEIPSEIIKRETEGLIDMSIAKTDDRSVVGSLTQLALDTEWIAEYSYERGDFDLNEIQKQLNRTPHVQREESFAQDALRKHLGLPVLPRVI